MLSKRMRYVNSRTDPRMLGAAALALALAPQATMAQAAVGEGQIDFGHTAFILVSMALVNLMTPGLAFFYGGLVREKNVLTMMMQSYIAMGVITIVWIVVGFSLCFGASPLGILLLDRLHPLRKRWSRPREL